MVCKRIASGVSFDEIGEDERAEVIRKWVEARLSFQTTEDFLETNTAAGQMREDYERDSAGILRSVEEYKNRPKQDSSVYRVLGCIQKILTHSSAAFV